MESNSRRLRERYYIGGRKDFGNIVVSPIGQPFVADTDRILIRSVSQPRDYGPPLPNPVMKGFRPSSQNSNQRRSMSALA
jgi:hypothetical protein